MMLPKTFSAIADLVTDAASPSRRRALTPDEMDAELREVRQRVANRAKLLARLQKRRAAWSQLSEDELEDLVVARLRRQVEAKRSSRGVQRTRSAH